MTLRRIGIALALVGLVATGVTVAASTASATTTSSSIYGSRGDHLYPGHWLVSPNGAYHAAMQTDGRFVVRTRTGAFVWGTVAYGGPAHLTMGTDGQVVLVAQQHVRWATNTHGAGSTVLTMRDDGVLVLTVGGALVWSTHRGNGCTWTSGKAVIVDVSQQYLSACYRGQQIRETPVTTGASALGRGTPLGTWHVQARVRDTVLHPASGGAYPVHYWMPYDGAYGLHDSPWQTFAYGSILYKTRGSHGCTHVPYTAMGWLFSWAPVGTRVTIRT